MALLGGSGSGERRRAAAAAVGAGVAIEQLRIFPVFAPGARAYVTYLSKETYSRIHVFPIPAV